MHAMTARQQGDEPLPPLTVSDVAIRLACPSSTVLRLIADGHLKPIRLGATARTLRIDRAELDRFIADGGIQGG